MLPREIAGLPIPDSALAAAATELVRDTETDRLFDHSLRVYLFGAIQGRGGSALVRPQPFAAMGLRARQTERTQR